MSFSAGVRVKLDNLTTTTLNGCLGRVLGTDADTGRIEVALDNGRTVKVLSSNVFTVRGAERGDVIQDNGPDFSGVLIDIGVKTVKAHPKISASYVIGVLLCLFFTGFAVSRESQSAYNNEMGEIEPIMVGLNKLEYKRDMAYNAYYQKKGFFSCDDVCTNLKHRFDQVDHEYNQEYALVQEKISHAKSHVGIFSTHGVEETRRLFWKRFGQGKDFAKRQTWWDALFGGIASMGRDENLMEFLMRLVINMLINFTIGLIGTVVGFMWTLWSVVKSFQPTTLEAAGFFIFASIAAMSFVASWLVGLYAATAGGAYVIGKTVASNRRLQGGPDQARLNRGAYRRYHQD